MKYNKYVKKENSKTKKIVLFAFLSILFLSFFSYTTSPLTAHYHGADSPFFMLIGKSMKNGYILYNDIFDTKGPIFFAIEYFGQIISEGKLGIFILQCLSLTVTIYISNNIFDLLEREVNTLKRIVSILVIFWIFSMTMEGGNLTEEFALPLLFFSLYLSIIYLKECDKGLYYHKPLYGFAYGLMFSILALSRITNAAFICSCVLSICIILIINKEYRCLLYNALAFIGGVIVIVCFTSVYFIINDNLYEMIYAVFIYAYSYATDISLQERLTYLLTKQKITLIIFCLLPIFVCILNKRIKTRYFMLAIISSILTIFVTTLGYCFVHYFTLIIPVVWYGIYLYLKDINNNKSNNVLVLFIVICLIFLQSGYVYQVIKESYKRILDINDKYSKSTTIDIEIGEMIPDSDKDSVWGFGTNSAFYLRNNLYPCIRHFDYLYTNLHLDTKNEIINELKNNPPKWIVIIKDKYETPEYVKDALQKYIVFGENEKYKLYKYSN